MIQLRKLLIFLLLAGPAGAQGPSTADFNAAWKDYQAADTSGDAAALVQTAERVLEIAETLFGPDDERVPMLMSNYGSALYEAGQRQEALAVLEQSVERTAAIHGKRSEKMIPILMNYADARARSFDARPMARTYDDALRIARDVYGERSLDYAGISLRAGLKILATNEPRTATRYLRKANDILMDLVGPQDVRTAFAQLNLGKLELSTRDYEDAIEYFQGALDGFDNGAPDTLEYELLTRTLLVQAFESLGMADEATEHCLAIGARSANQPDQDYLPIYRKAPDYPRDSLASKVNGHVDLAFTVDANGFVQNPRVIAFEGGESFQQAAFDAVAKFRYAPRFKEGEPVATENVETRITFRLEE